MEYVPVSVWRADDIPPGFEGTPDVYGVVPSSSVPSSTNRRVTRIVPALEPGTPVTVPRTFVDFVVTEYGIAELRGRSTRERANALIEIAHPDFRDELRSEARRLYAL